MRNFVYEGTPNRVVFGAGTKRQLPAELERLGIQRALLLATPGQREAADALCELLGTRAAGVHAKAVMHVPVESVSDAMARFNELQADGCVAVGGGSTVGLAKAIALRVPVPIVALPTTLAGSEMTPIWGITEAGAKRTGRDPAVLPRTVIYDPELSSRLPLSIISASGMNAIAHCVEGLYSENTNPVMDLLAEEGIRTLSHSLKWIVTNPTDHAARAGSLYGAWLAGMVLGNVGMALHHKLCHTLGGGFGLPHAEVHSVILPHAAAYNRRAAPDAMARIARALGCNDAPAGLFDLATAIGAPTALQPLGMAEADLDRAAALATQTPYANPGPITRDGIRKLLDDAFHGRRPDED